MQNKELISGLPEAFFGSGIGLGAVLTGWLSAGKVEYGFIPLGALLFALAALLLGLTQPALMGTVAWMVVLGTGAIFLIVPLHAILQWRSSADRRGAIIALSNVFSLGGMIAGSLGATALSLTTGFPIGSLLLISAFFVIAGALWSLCLLPDALLRVCLIILTYTFYRVRVIHTDRVPETGGLLLAPNHVALIDGLLIISVLDRPVRLVVDESYYDKWWLKSFMRGLKAIPITSTADTRQILRALREAGRYLDDGEVVYIFPEGQITRTGMVMPFSRGIDRIVKGRAIPIIPIYLDREWGSIFSFEGGRFVTK